jgi:hypothetical protein
MMLPLAVALKASIVSLAHSTVSGIVDRLESRGLRRAAPGDGHARHIYPSDPVRNFVMKELSKLSQGPQAEVAREPERGAAI